MICTRKIKVANQVLKTQGNIVVDKIHITSAHIRPGSSAIAAGLLSVRVLILRNTKTQNNLWWASTCNFCSLLS